VEHRLEPPGGEDLRHPAPVGEVGHRQFDALGHRPAVPLAEVVEHDDILPTVDEGEDQVAADVAGATRDEIAGQGPTP
jgi:hypothetical protein